MPKCNTLLLWACNSFINLGYWILSVFHNEIWNLENPWDDINSLYLGKNYKAQTYEPLSKLLKHVPVSLFQNLIVLSFDPPPDTNTFGNHGHQHIALTAAVCPSQDYLNDIVLFSHNNNWLSFAPELKVYPEGFQRKPQTS